MDELEPVPDETVLVMAADELCAEDACFVRVLELGDVEDSDEVSEWIKFLLDLGDADSEMIGMEDAISTGAPQFIEDAHGSVVWVDAR